MKDLRIEISRVAYLIRKNDREGAPRDVEPMLDELVEVAEQYARERVEEFILSSSLAHMIAYVEEMLDDNLTAEGKTALRNLVERVKKHGDVALKSDPNQEEHHG